MKELLRDPRIRRLLLANITGSIGSGVTLFAVPWLLVQQPGGNASYGTVTLVTTVVLFLFMPYYGVWVDHHSRKTMLLGSELFGFAAMGTLAAVCAFSGGYNLVSLCAIYFCGMLYYTLHFPAKFAFLQQVFDRSQYQSLMGLMEIQGQTAMMISGGLGAVLVEHVSLSTILLLDAGTYLFSFAIQSTIPYQATHLTADAAPRTSAWRAIGEGWTWLRDRPRLTVFFAASLLPFIAVMVGNYLFPIYIAQTLGAGAWVFGAGEVVFAAGAILAGLSLPRLIATHSARQTVPFTIAVFAAGAALLVLFPQVGAYLVAALLLGYGNAGSRVARSAAILHLVDNKVMGRVGSFFHAYDRVLRTVLTSAVIAIVAAGGPRPAFALLLALVLVGLVAVLRSRSALPPAA
ncbi:Major Facilitator Superfamily protein [Lacunisphaera limnophila]|uniref:Major Facilitator Superfamily protein n=1 Tax=Lacunisphaera limnophila TaxID=1838286 RepID=A0A1D8AUP2_9BACT|nr:MFS transporter [Lacunisphaera limnophila]AOS44608.1 Major Facilitator Superfamily protein [Lacunisphaera limnophila]